MREHPASLLTWPGTWPSPARQPLSSLLGERSICERRYLFPYRLPVWRIMALKWLRCLPSTGHSNIARVAGTSAGTRAQEPAFALHSSSPMTPTLPSTSNCRRYGKRERGVGGYATLSEGKENRTGHANCAIARLDVCNLENCYHFVGIYRAGKYQRSRIGLRHWNELVSAPLDMLYRK